MGEELPDVVAGLFGDLRDLREEHTALPLDRGQVADHEAVRLSGDPQIRSDNDSPATRLGDT